MTARRYALFWVGLAVLLLLLLILLGGILLPFLLGALIAYLLDPVADRLEQVGISRLWAAVLILTVFALILILFLLLVVPILIDQAVQLASALPNWLSTLRQVITDIGEKWGERATQTDVGLESAVRQLATGAPQVLGGVLSSLWSGGLALVNFLALFLVTPVVAFYMLRDWDGMIARIDSWLPREQAPTVRMLAREIDEVISGFVRGQILVLLLLSAMYVAGLVLIGLNFGLLIGLCAGLVSFVPYVGPMVGYLVGGTAALVQFWPNWTLIAAVLGVFVVGQIVEGNVLSPAIVGDKVHLHPVWVIFALFAFGYLFGFVGLVIAVPLAAAIGVLVRFGLHSYLQSPFYSGSETGGPQTG